jgi:hypothetical protein
LLPLRPGELCRLPKHDPVNSGHAVEGRLLLELYFADLQMLHPLTGCIYRSNS